MTQSKLEVHLQILKAIAQNSPAKENIIAVEANISQKQLEQALIFQATQGLIECDRTGVYMITRRGLAVLRHFRLLGEPEEVELNC